MTNDNCSRCRRPIHAIEGQYYPVGSKMKYCLNCINELRIGQIMDENGYMIGNIGRKSMGIKYYTRTQDPQIFKISPFRKSF